MPHGPAVLRILLVLLGLWLALVVIGWVVKGLFWLVVGGVLVLLVIAVLGAARRR